MLHIFLFAFLSMSENLLLEFGHAPTLTTTEITQQEFTLFTWNIYKGQELGLYRDLQKLVENSDFVLTQEFLLNESQRKLMNSLPGTHWSVAKSFESGGEWTGVATMSKWQPTESLPVKSPGAEPFVGTPKMALITKYKMAGTDLWVVNLHALNFDITHVDFEEQIDDMVERLKHYSGPLIFAGDFNTWADYRREYLMEKTRSLGLKRVELENPMGIFSATLDHIFYRGVQVLEFRAMDEIQSSDHLPLSIRFTLKGTPFPFGNGVPFRD